MHKNCLALVCVLLSGCVAWGDDVVEQSAVAEVKSVLETLEADESRVQDANEVICQNDESMLVADAEKLGIDTRAILDSHLAEHQHNKRTQDIVLYASLFVGLYAFLHLTTS